MSKSNVSRTCKEAETSKDPSAAVFMSPSKNIELQRQRQMKTILRTMSHAEPCLDFITQKISNTGKNNTFSIRKNILYRLSYFCFNL